MLGQSAGILFRIKADSSQAERELSSVSSQVAGLGGSLSALGGPATVAAAAIAAVGAAAVIAGKFLFDLTNAASEYGSAIFDASEKTGLSAETLSALDVAAKQSGTSLEAITGSLSRFAKTIGEANDGNDKAQAKLAKVGVTSRELETALGQALQTIAKYPAGVEQMTAAQAAFGKSGADLLPLIKSFDGDLPGLIAKFKELGVTLSDEDARAADEFGDTLDMLSTQASAVGRKFAFELMPFVTQAMQSISNFLTANQGVVAAWGNATTEVIRGAINAYGLFSQGVASAFNNITAQYGIHLKATEGWANGLVEILTPIITIFRQLSPLGAGLSDKVNSTVAAATAPVIRAGKLSLPTFAGVGGGGGAGKAGKSPVDNSAREAEELRQKEVAAAELAVRSTLEIYRAGYDQRIALLEQSLQLGVITEVEKVRDVARVRQEAIQDEIRLNKELLNNPAFNGDERLVIEQKLKVLTIELTTERIKGGTEINEQVQKEIKAKEALIEKEKELLEIERRRLRDKRNAAAQARIDEDRAEQARLAALNPLKDLMDTWTTFVARVYADAPSLGQVMQSVGGMFVNAFQGMAQAVGNLVQQWVLMGTTGPAMMRKLLATALASLAAEAATRAIFELAMGFATLFTNPGESAGHFAAAALFGGIAVGTALAGRAIAGDSFKQSAGAASGQSVGGSQGDSSELRYTTAFQGYGQNNLLVRTLDRINETIGQAEETFHEFKEKFGTASPGAVVMAGAKDASRDIRDAVIGELSSDVATTDGMMRGLGFAR